jgi:hypothetical protein
MLASASDDGTVRIWGPAQHEEGILTYILGQGSATLYINKNDPKQQYFVE